MDRARIAWHVGALLDTLAARLATTPETLVAFGLKEDLDAFGEAVAATTEPDAPTQIDGVWEDRQDALTPVVAPDERKLRG